MQIELGTRIRTADGEDVGKVDKLILDPATGAARAVVVRKGFILHEDIVIPLDAVQVVREGEARRAAAAEGLERFPRFSEREYTGAPPDYTSPFGYPGSGVLWPVEAAYPQPVSPAYPPAPPAVPPTPVAASPEPPLPEEAKQVLADAVIEEGSDVVSRDGEKVGEIHGVALDADSGRPTRIVVRKGFLFTQDFELPASAIASVDDRVIYLNLDKDQLRRTIVTIV